jgi:hypothetical protein
MKSADSQAQKTPANGSRVNGRGQGATGNSFHAALPKAAAMMNAPKIRVTLVMPKPLDSNVELFCHVSGRKKLDVVSTAIADFLERNGVADPYRDQTAKIDQLLKGLP